MRHALRLTAAAVLIFAAGGAAAQQFPTKPIRLIIGNGPGSTPDIVSRTFASGVETLLGQPMIVENRAGAEGIIAANAVAQATPDGYTLLMASQQVFAISPHTRKGMPFDVERDFAPVAVVIDTTLGNSLVVHKSVPVSNIKELIAYAKANPNKLTYSTSVANQSLYMAWLKKRAGIELREVRYKDSNMSVQDVIGGRVHIGVNSHVSWLPPLEQGEVKLLATAASQRFKEFPDVPIITEIFPDYNMNGFFVLVGPAKVPQAAVERINKAADTVVKGIAFQEVSRKIQWYNTQGARTPKGAGDMMRRQREVYAEVTRDLGIKPQ